MQISLRLALFVTVSLAGFISTLPVMANGVTNIELFSKTEGPIQIAIFSRDASHLVGQLSLSVHVLEDNIPIEVEEIFIKVEGSDGARYIANGSISPILPIHYDVSVPVTSIGDYNLKPIVKLEHLTIDGSFIVTVSDTIINWEIIASILVGILLILPAIIIVSRK